MITFPSGYGVCFKTRSSPGLFVVLGRGLKRPFRLHLNMAKGPGDEVGTGRFYRIPMNSTNFSLCETDLVVDTNKCK